MAVDRSCYTCRHFALCFLRVSMDATIRAGIHMLNINTTDTPGTQGQLFDVLAAACLRYEQSEEVKAREEGANVSTL